MPGSWRLQRMEPGLFALGCDVKEDIVDLEDRDLAPMKLKLLELRRWKQARAQLMSMIRNFDFSDNPKASVPTLTTWLLSLKLEKLKPKLELLGAVELADLAVRCCSGGGGGERVESEWPRDHRTLTIESSPRSDSPSCNSSTGTW
jgi:hypothetical protein